MMDLFERVLLDEEVPPSIARYVLDFALTFSLMLQAWLQGARLHQTLPFFWQNQFTFQPYHKAIREPFDYYTFGQNYIRPLVDFR
jgi:hypothetical protein